jgi:hypothetical protein
MGGREIIRWLVAQEVGLQITPLSGDDETVDAEYHEVTAHPPTAGQEYGAIFVYVPEPVGRQQPGSPEVWVQYWDPAEKRHPMMFAQPIRRQVNNEVKYIAVFPEIPVSSAEVRIWYGSKSYKVSIFPNFVTEVVFDSIS